MAHIELKNVRKTFKEVVAVNDMNLQVEDGEFIAFLGPSGCGKTTTLRIISGLETPDSGTITIDEQDVTDLPPRSRDVAMVFQDYALYPHMSILDNIGYPLKIRGVSRGELKQEVQKVAANLQIDNLLERRPGQLSGGQQQRAAVARAVVHKAKIFLFDEPLSNLDAKLRLEARAFLKHLQQEVGITSIYVTHDQAEAMSLADRIVVMRAGEVMQVGTPVEIYQEPANIFVASFIGNPPMNLIPCEVTPEGVRLMVEGEAGTVTLPLANPPQSSGPLTLGVRPEHITVHAEQQPDSIPVKLYVTQTLGGEALVLVHVGDQLVSVRIFDEMAPELPEKVYLTFDMSRLFFYGEDEQLIR